MALSKKITYSNGTEANYHKIHTVALTHRSVITHTENGEEVIDTGYEMIVNVYSYVSKDIRKINEHANLTTYVAREFCALDAIKKSNIMALAYDIVKKTDQFSGAEDI